MFSRQVLQSRMFSPRTCLAQNIELLSWEEGVAAAAAAEQQLQQQQQLGDWISSATTREVDPQNSTLNSCVNDTVVTGGVVVTVNCAYSLSSAALLALVSGAAEVEGGVFAYDC